MIEFFIDGRSVEIAPDAGVVLSAAVGQLTEPDNIREQRFPLRLPMTPANRKAMKYTEQLLSPELFNQNTHTGEIRCKGAILLYGKVELTGCETNETGSGHYRVELVVAPPEWITDAREKRLREINLHYEALYNEETIRQSWTNDSPVKFLPVKRDRYPAYGTERITLRQLTAEDYHPFIRVKTLVDKIVEDAGYRIVSEFLNEPFFESLYMSGRYARQVASDAPVQMNFTARSSAADARSSTADSEGKVYATALHAQHSVGNPVDRAEEYPGITPGNDPAALYYGKCFRMVEGRPAFIPSENVIAAFEITLEYITGTLIQSQEKRIGISRLVWENETIYDSTIPNPLTDRKNISGESGYYRAVCFDPTAGSHRVRVYLQNGKTELFYTDNNVHRIYLPSAYDYVACDIADEGDYRVTENWAFYCDAEYEAAGSFENKITVVTPPRLREKDQPVFLDSLVFENGAPGQSFSLSPGISIRPVFYSAPGIGSALTIPAVFDHPEYQMKLISALSHLFRLHFYTDERTKTIYAEPGFTFLNQEHTIDWSHKIDDSKPLIIEEEGREKNRTERLRYKPGDATIERFKNKTGVDYGAWVASVENKFAQAGERIRENPLFTASFDEKGSLNGAADASLIVAGNRNSEEGDLNFPPKIVRYTGLKKLPQQQRWGWPSYGEEYPLVMFHSAGEDWYTLCFDDEGGQLGLKNYHESAYDRINKSKRLTVYLHLTPSDMEAILYPNSAERDFRGNFIFRIRGEKIRGRLTAISGYDPSKGDSTRCTFSIEF